MACCVKDLQLQRSVVIKYDLLEVLCSLNRKTPYEVEAHGWRMLKSEFLFLFMLEDECTYHETHDY